jgi:hypothetical protein
VSHMAPFYAARNSEAFYFAESMRAVFYAGTALSGGQAGAGF